MQSKSYVEKYYDIFLRSSNRGFMTLVSEIYFEFGFKSIEKVSLALTQDIMNRDIESVETGKEILIADKELHDNFIEISKNNNFLEKECDITNIYHELLDKVVNSRFSEEYCTYREENTVRGGKAKESNLAFRGELDAM